MRLRASGFLQYDYIHILCCFAAASTGASAICSRFVKYGGKSHLCVLFQMYQLIEIQQCHAHKMI